VTTLVPSALLHLIRDAATAVRDFADLALTIACPCGDDHGRVLHTLGGDQ
jgi:hypothetical protein